MLKGRQVLTRAHFTQAKTLIREFGSTAGLGPVRKTSITRLNLHGNHLSAVRKINDGDFDISLEEAQELYEFLSEDEASGGDLDFEQLASFLQRSLSPSCAAAEIRILWELTDHNSDGSVSAEEVHKILTSRIFREHYMQLQAESRASDMLATATGGPVKLTRDLLVERLAATVGRDDAFRTLPYSLAVFIVFIVAVALHLQVRGRMGVGRGIEQSVGGYALAYTGPFLVHDVADGKQMWDWLELSILPLLFSHCDNSTGSLGCSVAAAGRLLGSPRVAQAHLGTGAGGGQWDASDWLLASQTAQGFLLDDPQNLTGAALLRLDELRDAWYTREDDSLSVMTLVFLAYNDESTTISLTEASLNLDADGMPVRRCRTRAASVEPYANKASIAVDILYLGLFLYQALNEIRDLVTDIRLRGLRVGCCSYWGLWNTVDWVAISCGLANAGVWAYFCILCHNHIILGLFQERAGRRTLAPRIMQLGASQLDSIELHVRKILWLLFVLQCTMALNSICIMVKFFKGFRANARLQVVSDTLARSAEDIFHFAVVFLTVFSGFSLIGHVLFGNDLKPFSSFAKACNTAWVILHGNMDWYDDTSAADEGLSSKLPYTLVAVWFFLYVMFVFMILLNMLLVMVMDQYVALIHHLKVEPDAPTLWQQGFSALQAARATRGFIPMGDISTLLEDKETPAHTATVVTLETLQEAFPAMTEEQAVFLCEWLQKAAKRSAHQMAVQHESYARLRELKVLGQSMHNQVRMIALVQQRGVQSLTAVAKAKEAHNERVHTLEGMLVSVGRRLSSLEKKRERGRKSAPTFGLGPPPPRGPPEPGTRPQMWPAAAQDSWGGAAEPPQRGSSEGFAELGLAGSRHSRFGLTAGIV